jgi:hypothetical protein
VAVFVHLEENADFGAVKYGCCYRALHLQPTLIAAAANVTPLGHWLYLTSQSLESEHLRLKRPAEIMD